MNKTNKEVLNKKIAHMLGWENLFYGEDEGVRSLWGNEPNTTSGVAQCPNWVEDLGAAMNLLIDHYPYNWSVQYEAGQYEVGLIDGAGFPVSSNFTENKNDLALTICEAWIESHYWEVLHYWYGSFAGDQKETLVKKHQGTSSRAGCSLGPRASLL